MKSLKLKVILSFLLILAPYMAFAVADHDLVDQKIQAFIKKYSQSEFAYELSPDELRKSLSESNLLTAGFDAQLKSISEIDSSRAGSPQKDFNRLNQILQIRSEALGIAKAIYDQNNKTDIIAALIMLNHRSIFEPDIRGPLDYLFAAIDSYKFSEDEQRKLMKDSSAYGRFSNGYLDTAAIIVPVSFFLCYWNLAFCKSTAEALPKIAAEDKAQADSSTKTLIEGEGREAKNIAEKIAVKETAEAVGKQELKTEQDLYNFLRSEGLLRPREVFSVKNTEKIASDFSKWQFSNWMSRLPDKKWLLNLMTNTGLFTPKYAAVIFGASAVGGASDVGLHAFYQYLFKDHEDLNAVEPTKLRDDYYGKLAVLDLSCKSRALLFEAQKLPAVGTPLTDEMKAQRFEVVKNLNEIYSEFLVLKNILPYNSSKVALPPPPAVTIDLQTGTVHFQFQILDHKDSGQIDCKEKFQGQKINENFIEVSLPEVLYDVAVTYSLLSEKSPSDQPAPDNNGTGLDDTNN